MLGIAGFLGLSGACDWDYERMIDQPRYEAYEPNPYLPDGVTLQPAPAGTVPRDALIAPAVVLTGIDQTIEESTGQSLGDGRYARVVPVPVTRALLERGRDRFAIVCATCHGPLGDGDSEVAENMRLVRPPSFHQPRLRAFPAGRLFAVASDGYGLMPGYREVLDVGDRWAVVAFIQALQISQHAELSGLPAPIAEEARSWLK